MDSKWMCLLLLDLIALTCSSPGRFYHDFHDPQHNQYHGTTIANLIAGLNPAVTQAKETADTPEGFNRAQTSKYRPTPTLPQPVINDGDIRFGETANTDSARPPSKPLIAVAPPPKKIEQTIQGTLSKPVPKINGTNAPAYQWHVGVYSKSRTPYMQICGGSLVKQDFVISAAHCFWDDTTGQQPASQFAVAGGKLFRPWNDTRDSYAQTSDVSQIILPVHFRGSATSFQDDIAILRLTTAFTYTPGVQSVCVDFDIWFDREQLRPGNLGTVAGWGLTEENGTPSQSLNYLELPYVDVAECIASSQPTFLEYFTSDKICAGDTFTGKALCRGDSGGGLVLFSNSTPYLRGVASTAAGNTNLCNAFAIAAFTQINAHRTFLRDNIPGVDTECSGNARGTTEQDRSVNLLGITWNTETIGYIAIPSAVMDKAGSTGYGVKDMRSTFTGPFTNTCTCNCK